jgi:hypothetical protein
MSDASTLPTPSFDEGISRFRAFLVGQGLGSPIRWIWRDDIITRRAPGSRNSWFRPVFVDFTRPNDNDAVRNRYEAGVTRGLGVEFHVFCVCAGTPCAFIYIPENAVDAEHRMIWCLKCSMPTPCLEATAVTSPIRARWLRMTRGTSIDASILDIPRRSEAPNG